MAPRGYGRGRHHDYRYGQQQFYDSLPDDVRVRIETVDPEQDRDAGYDETFVQLFNELFEIRNGRVDYDNARIAHDELQEWMRERYNIDLDDTTIWKHWRENYNAQAS